ncbi:MAG: hypothetical protein IPJ40_08675 [Saprospirales bacterium]|nr:hypothetical protein [Saprospirales bacterium]
MPNETHIQGSQHIVIQNVTDSTLTLQVNGEVREIQNQLAELKALLECQNAQKVQYAEKIYNIEHIDEANFGFLTGKKAFNELLTRELIRAIQPNCTSAQRFLEKVAHIPDWESQTRISDKAKEIIAYSFVGVIGKQLSKLMAIGKEDFSEAKQRKYLEKCIDIVKRSLDLVCFALLSRLWDAQKTRFASFLMQRKKPSPTGLKMPSNPLLRSTSPAAITPHHFFEKRIPPGFPAAGIGTFCRRPASRQPPAPNLPANARSPSKTGQIPI